MAAAITSELRALSFTSVDGVPNTSVTTTFTLSDTSSAYGVDTSDSQLSTLATFTGPNGAKPLSDLVSDATGDLFGVTFGGGADNDGTIFEIAKSTGALTTMASSPAPMAPTRGASPATRQAICSGRQPLAGRTATAQCSRSPTPPAN